MIADAALTASLLRFSRTFAGKGCLIRPEFFLCLLYVRSRYRTLSIPFLSSSTTGFLSASCASEMQREGANFPIIMQHWVDQNAS